MAVYCAGLQDLNESLGGVHNFCTGLRAYHMIGINRIPDGMRPTFMQLYIHDQKALNDCMAMQVAQTLNRIIVNQLQSELHLVNPFERRFKAVNAEQLRPNVDIVIHADIGTTCLPSLPALSSLLALPCPAYYALPCLLYLPAFVPCFALATFLASLCFPCYACLPFCPTLPCQLASLPCFALPALLALLN